VIRALVVDFDGPVFDARAARDRAYDSTVSQFADRLGASTIHLGSTPLYGPTRFVANAFPGLPEALRGEVLDFYRRELTRLELEASISSPTRSWLERLHQTVDVCIFTGRLQDNIEQLLEAFGLQDLFRVVVGQGGVHDPKPAPDGLLHIMELLRIEDPRTILMLGDSDLDFAAAADAGIGYRHAAWSLEPSTVLQRAPGVAIREPQHLLDILAAESEVKPSVAEPPAELVSALDAGQLGWFAGAGVSVSSGFGSWTEQYLPLLASAHLDWMTDHRDMPEVLQLGCVDPQTASDVFTSFRTAFVAPHRPNGYHFAMVRSKAIRIWTSNYDQLFERAIIDSGLSGVRTVYDDQSLLDQFADGNLVIKVNGDFERGRWDDQLDWNLVATQEQFDKADNRRAEIWRLFEDDFRNRSLVFVGVSLQDPVLRRVLAIAAGRVARTRHRHFILTKIADDVTERALQRRVELSLLRYRVRTLYFADYAGIQQLVATLAARAVRPIIGVSGDTETPQEDPDGRGADDVVLPGGQIRGQVLREACSSMGRVLARAGYRVTSGGAPYVGIDAVNSAFAENENLARFYLRRGGRPGGYQRTAPVVIINPPTYDAVRTRFVGELAVLLAIGGRMLDRAESGVVDEIERALERRAPVLLFPQAGGAVAAHHASLLARLGTSYGDSRLTQVVMEANEKASQVPGDGLVRYVEQELVSEIGRLVNALVEAGVDVPAARTADAPPW
jgi:phosphoglycolate phosphatase-like HAD superfamily hydrolase